MSTDLLIGFAVGAFSGALIVAVLYAPILRKHYTWAKVANVKIRDLDAQVKHMQQSLHPELVWDDDPQNSVRVKAKLYDKHDGLYEPGSDVIRIESQGDVPDLPAGWREREGKIGT